MNFLRIFLSEYRWFRKWYGGKWFQTHVDFPVCSFMWLSVPDDAEPGIYREPLWRGTPNVEVWPK